MADVNEIRVNPLPPLKVGDKVTRWVGGLAAQGGIPMRLVVTKVEPNLITCAHWTFDPVTGAEVDDDLDWGPPPKGTGSILVKD